MRLKFSVSILVTLLVGCSWLAAQVQNFRPVTEPILRNPAPGDWLNWRRTDNAWGYSPLDQINTRNVERLQLAWSWAMDNTGAQEATPLAYDGVMYLPNPHGVIQALDAAARLLISALDKYAASSTGYGTGSPARPRKQRKVEMTSLFRILGNQTWHIIEAIGASSLRDGSLVAGSLGARPRKTSRGQAER
jgi:hypothetical protein